MAGATLGSTLAGPGPGSGKPSLKGALVVFQYRDYRYLWVSSLFSFTGMQMQQVARALLAWQLTHSFGAVGAISLSFGLPMLLFSLVGGSLADRFDKRNLTLVSQLVTAALALINAVMLVTGTITFEWLFILGLGGGTASALGMPARSPMMAEAVGPDHVMSAMALSNAAMNATRLFGPAIAGAMVALWNLDSVYFLQAGLYVVASVTMLAIPTSKARARAHAAAGGAPLPLRKPPGNMFKEIGLGLAYVWRDPRLRMLNGMMFIVSFFAMPYVMLLAGFVKKDLDGGDAQFGLLQSVSGVGALVGSIGIAMIAGFDRKGLIQWVSGVIGGLGLVGLAVGSHSFGFGGAVVAILILGLALTAYQTLNSTMIMDAAEPQFYGRVMSINMLSFSAMPLMAFPMGKIADIIGARETFTIQGLVVVGFMVLVAAAGPARVFGRVPVRVRPPLGPRVAVPAPASDRIEDGATAGGG